MCANVHLWRRWSSLKHCFLAWCIGLAVFWWVGGLPVQVGAALRPAFAPDTSSDVTAAACEVWPLKQCVGRGCFWRACFLSPGHGSVWCVAMNAKGVWWGEKFEGESAGVCVFCGRKRRPLSKYTWCLMSTETIRLTWIGRIPRKKNTLLRQNSVENKNKVISSLALLLVFFWATVWQAWQWKG